MYANNNIDKIKTFQFEDTKIFSIIRAIFQLFKNEILWVIIYWQTKHAIYSLKFTLSKTIVKSVQ